MQGWGAGWGCTWGQEPFRTLILTPLRQEVKLEKLLRVGNWLLGANGRLAGSSSHFLQSH